MCFNNPPADWAAAMSKTAAFIPGGNFGLIAVDDFFQIAYGYLQTASGGGIWGVDLRSGQTFLVSRMTASQSGVIWAGLDGDWLVWAQGESHDVLGDWTIQAWNGKGGTHIQLASSELPDGTYVQNELVFPVVGHGYMAWNQPTSRTSADLRVYSIFTGKFTTLDSGNLSFPVFAGHYLVWAKAVEGQSNPSLRFVDADTLQPVRTPAELARPLAISYLAGSDVYLLWMSGDEVTVDYLLIRRMTAYKSSSHHLQFPTLAGHYLVWFGADTNSVVDLYTGSGFDVPLPGSVAAAGDTIVVAKLAPPPTKGAITSTTISVLHPSALSSLPPCAA